MSTLTNAAELSAAVRASAPETERERRLPEPLLDQLREAGCLRMWAPRSYGGDELALAESLRVITELARSDGAVGWVVGQLAMAQAVLSRFPRAEVDHWYADGPDVLGAGAVAPKGKARPTASGWQASGQWPYVTGSRHASFFYGQCLALTGEASPTDGPPALRTVLVPMSAVEIIETWSTLGLRGTGSHDVRLRSVELPADQVTDLVGARSAVDHPLGRISTVELSGLVVAASMIGIALGAVDEVVAVARGGKRPAFSRTALADSDHFRQRLGQSYAELRAAAALLTETAEIAWAEAIGGPERALVDRGLLRATVHQVALATVSCTSVIFGLAGGSSVYDDSALQHRLRDIHTAAQHGVAGPGSSTILGGALVQVSDQSLEW